MPSRCTHSNIIPWGEASDIADRLYLRTCMRYKIYFSVSVLRRKFKVAGYRREKERPVQSMCSLKACARAISIELSSRRASNWNDFSLLSRVIARMRYHLLFSIPCCFAIFNVVDLILCSRYIIVQRASIEHVIEKVFGNKECILALVSRRVCQFTEPLCYYVFAYQTLIIYIIVFTRYHLACKFCKSYLL